MVGFLHILDEWLELHPKVSSFPHLFAITDSHVQVKLVVMDTLSYHFRQPTLEHGSRKRVMELYVLLLRRSKI
jgi:RAD51-like protein 2